MILAKSPGSVITPGLFLSILGLENLVSHEPTEVTVFQLVKEMDTKEYRPTKHLPRRTYFGEQPGRFRTHAKQQSGIEVKPND